MIYDCNWFYKSLDLLEIRMHELDSVVDKFVIVEGKQTTTGLPKELLFEKNMNNEIFIPFGYKTIYVVIDDTSVVGIWVREESGFNGVSCGLVNCQDDDIIMLSHGDEIPRATAVQELKNRMQENPGIYQFHQQCFRHYINGLFPEANPWCGTVAATYRIFKAVNNAYQLRMTSGPASNLIISNGGWHYSWCGGPERMKDRGETYAHAPEFNDGRWNDREKVLRILNLPGNVIRMDENSGSLHFRPIDSAEVASPKYVLENIDRFKHLIREYN